MIRKAKLQDSICISKLIVSNWKTAYKGLIGDEYLNNLSVEETNRGWKKYLEKSNSNNFVYLYEKNKKILGVIRFGNPSEKNSKYNAEIYALYVEPSVKRNGVGSKLFKYATNYFKKNNKTNMIVWCLNGNTPSIKFYERMGGRIVDKKKNIVHNIPLEEVGIEYNLNLHLRKYETTDASEIVKWIENEKDLRLWSADRYANFPICGENINNNYDNNSKKENFYPMTFVDNDKVIGHIIFRNPIPQKKEIVRLGFIIVDPAMRKQGYGKILMGKAIDYAKNILNAKEITLGVFENNIPALNLYKSIGFKIVDIQENAFEYKNELWNLVEMNI